jgi:hypothetical protein
MKGTRDYLAYHDEVLFELAELELKIDANTRKLKFLYAAKQLGKRILIGLAGWAVVAVFLTAAWELIKW